MIWSNFSVKILGIKFDNFVSDNSNWDKIRDNIAKKNSYVEQSETLLERQETYKKSSSTFKLLVHRTDVCCSKIH